MRLYIKTTPNIQPIPFNYQDLLLGVLHKWLGANEPRGQASLYSYSWLQGGKRKDEGLDFANGSQWFISFYDDVYAKQIARSVLSDPGMFFGMSVTDVSTADAPDLSKTNRFLLGSPVLIKFPEENGNIKHYTYDDPLAPSHLTNTIIHKMTLANLPIDDTLHIQFDQTYPRRKMKLATIHGIKNKCIECPVLIKGLPSTKAFIWNVGLGNATGIGFGSIK